MEKECEAELSQRGLLPETIDKLVCEGFASFGDINLLDETSVFQLGLSLQQALVLKRCVMDMRAPDLDFDHHYGGNQFQSGASSGLTPLNVEITGDYNSDMENMTPIPPEFQDEYLQIGASATTPMDSRSVASGRAGGGRAGNGSNPQISARSGVAGAAYMLPSGLETKALSSSNLNDELAQQRIFGAAMVRQQRYGVHSPPPGSEDRQSSGLSGAGGGTGGSGGNIVGDGGGFRSNTLNINSNAARHGSNDYMEPPEAEGDDYRWMRQHNAGGNTLPPDLSRSHVYLGGGEIGHSWTEELNLDAEPTPRRYAGSVRSYGGSVRSVYSSMTEPHRVADFMLRVPTSPSPGLKHQFPNLNGIPCVIIDLDRVETMHVEAGCLYLVPKLGGAGGGNSATPMSIFGGGGMDSIPAAFFGGMTSGTGGGQFSSEDMLLGAGGGDYDDETGGGVGYFMPISPDEAVFSPDDLEQYSSCEDINSEDDPEGEYYEGKEIIVDNATRQWIEQQEPDDSEEKYFVKENVVKVENKEENNESTA